MSELSKSAGERFADEILALFQLEPHERLLLDQVESTVDVVEGLERAVEREGILERSPAGTRASAAVVELRQQRQLLGRLLAALRVPDAEGRRPQRRPARGIGRLH